MTKQFLHILSRRPHAAAVIRGSNDYPHIHGHVRFYQTSHGILVAADLCDLPQTDAGIFAFHIHTGSTCTGNTTDPFAHADGHFNPCSCEHPRHAGDLPPLLACNGRAFLVCLTARFRVQDIIGRTVIIHSHPDDFHTQPSGSAGTKIACGEIRRCL